MSSGSGHGGPDLTPDLILKVPVTASTIVVCTVIWLYLWNYNIDAARFGYQYDAVVVRKELWRVVSASYGHLHPLHLLFNMVALWNTAMPMELLLGRVASAKYTFLLLVCSMAVLTLITFVEVRYLGRVFSATTYSLGYSCVVFGWMAIACEYMEKAGAQPTFLGFQMPGRLLPWVSLGLTQLIVPNASLVGHLSGIVIGEAIFWGAFIWFLDVVFAVSLLAFVAIIAYSVLKPVSRADGTHRFSPVATEEGIRMRVVNGVLVPVRDST